MVHSLIKCVSGKQLIFTCLYSVLDDAYLKEWVIYASISTNVYKYVCVCCMLIDACVCTYMYLYMTGLNEYLKCG